VEYSNYAMIGTTHLEETNGLHHHHHLLHHPHHPHHHGQSNSYHDHDFDHHHHHHPHRQVNHPLLSINYQFKKSFAVVLPPGACTPSSVPSNFGLTLRFYFYKCR